MDTVSGVSKFMSVYYYDPESKGFVEVDPTTYERFVVTDQMLTSNFNVNDRCMLVVHSTGQAPVVSQYAIQEVDSGGGIYGELFDLLARYLYGHTIGLSPEQNLVLTILATALVIAVVVIPFLLVIWIFKAWG